ncbi:MAG TPA: protein phosphatase 2C domain-containing protein [Gemmatimonadaceae bacterium]
MATPVTIDAFGLTHTGKVRPTNEDHFIVVEVHRSVDILCGSLSSAALTNRIGTSSAYLLAVADGVGGGPDGDVASERTTAAVLSYVGKAAVCFSGLNVDAEHELLEALESTVRRVHAELLGEAPAPNVKTPATTLTLVLLAWPRAYLVHVGDSRAYVRRRGRVQAMTRDQTFGEYMVSVGAWSEDQATKFRTAETLASAIGGSEMTPSVGLVDLEPGDSLLLCTDGLTKHVTDQRIEEVLAQPLDAKGMAETLVNEALSAGGSDNVSVIVARGVA